MIIFKVNVIGYNVDTFRDNYLGYITKEENGHYGEGIFTLKAPKEVYDEISNLKEECIDIIE